MPRARAHLLTVASLPLSQGRLRHDASAWAAVAAEAAAAEVAGAAATATEAVEVEVAVVAAAVEVSCLAATATAAAAAAASAADSSCLPATAPRLPPPSSSSESAAAAVAADPARMTVRGGQCRPEGGRLCTPVLTRGLAGGSAAVRLGPGRGTGPGN